MINFLKRLFGYPVKDKDQEQSRREREYVQHHDMVDYDGMGNQGRFPTYK